MRYLLAFTLLAVLAGCSGGEEETKIGDNPIAGNARSAKDPEFANRPPHTTGPPPTMVQEEGVR